jgi:hypothetical protein
MHGAGDSRRGERSVSLTGWKPAELIVLSKVALTVNIELMSFAAPRSW